MSILQKIMIIHFAQCTSVKTNKLLQSQNIDIIWKLYAYCSSGCCHKIAVQEYWVQLLFHFTPVSVRQV